ncbi:N-acetylmuramic acid 6-phosphate etherase [uncultured Kiloniella sp.]|uniref:N-acetylmuramic acid 6-phosphate etherase n=1 Tax=uncultured Kiloniella sp. TaxID=1133091 RepID=UPI0026137A37|nr:N-acetylmuramic acid 6-phosphate etherase [uncultured Kiloniella sp.]
MSKDIQGTEKHSPRYHSIDTWPAEDMLESLWASQLRAISCIQQSIPEISASAEAIAERLSHGGRLFYIGAGSSGHLAIQDCVEINPTYGWPLDKLIPLIAGGKDALLAPMGGAEDDERISVKSLKAHAINAQDVIIAVAASGSTPYTLAAVKHARSQGSLVISVANNRHAPIYDHAHHSIFLDSGSEVIAGSTRMAAGTAQKAALNMLSTLTMTKLGHVHDGLMVSMVINNEKLEKRGAAIIQEITGSDSETAKKCLNEADKNIKLAVLLAMNHPKAEAEKALADNQGHLRQAMEKLKVTY